MDKLLDSYKDTVVSIGAMKGSKFSELDIEYLRKASVRSPGDDTLKHYAKAKTAMADLAATPKDGEPIQHQEPAKKEEKAFKPVTLRTKPHPSPGISWLSRIMSGTRTAVYWSIHKFSSPQLFLAAAIVMTLLSNPKLAGHSGRLMAHAIKGIISFGAEAFTHFCEELWAGLSSPQSTSHSDYIKRVISETTEGSEKHVHITLSEPSSSMFSGLVGHILSIIIGGLITTIGFLRQQTLSLTAAAAAASAAAAEVVA